MTGLQPNKDYKVAVAALNANGAGPKSQEVSFKTDIGGMTFSHYLQKRYF